MKIMKMYTQDQLDQVVDAFQAHKVLALPTDTVYGVGVLYGDLADLDHLKHAKHRPETKPIPMMVSNLEQMKQIAKVDARTEKLVQTFLPGPLTLVLPVSETLDLAYTNGKKTVAVRIPDEPFVLTVIEKLGKPLLVSSANVSGKPVAVSYQEAMDNLPNIDGIIQGECKQLEASTIVDCTQDKLSILRPGPILLKELTNCL